MSTNTSRFQRTLKSRASCATMHTASGSSPFTWKIGASIIFATSVQYLVERASPGSVVKPIWLLMTKWTVPPVL